MPDKELLIRISSVEASDAWGFVGVVCVGDIEAYRTLESFATPEKATRRAQELVASFMGEVLAGREWRAVRENLGHIPLRQDYHFSALGHRRPTSEES